jgi:hypothetical protein
VSRDLGPPQRERPGPHPETGSNHKALAADTNTLTANRTAIARGLRQRRCASWRLPVLDCGRSDPWWYAPSSAGYEDAAAHLLELGLTPAPNREGLHRMYNHGGQRRVDAELIAERWGLVA